MYLVQTPALIKLIRRNYVWSIGNTGKKIYITFDDGPEPEITPAILKILEQFKAKATFFCVGEKIIKCQSVFNEIRNLGHAIGNHSFHHIRSEKLSVNDLLQEIEKCNELVNSRFYRPPYGKISCRQARAIRKRYHIILWDVLPGDFDGMITKERCLTRALKYTKSGSIIVFHDNLKSKEKILYVLPQYLEHFSKLGYTFEALSEDLFL